jgi:hypothetical protein
MSRIDVGDGQKQRDYIVTGTANEARTEDQSTLIDHV